jgi:hypothetical protein
VDDVHNWERKARTDPATVLMGMARRVPEIWRLRSAARAMAARLPRYRGEVEPPGADEIFAWIEGLCATPHRRPGTVEGHRAERWVEDRLRELGLEGVTADPVPIEVWTARRWGLTVEGAGGVPSFFVVNAGFTGPDGVEAELVDVGRGRPSDFDRRDVRGRIVVADVAFPVLPTGVLLRVAGVAYAVSDPGRALTVRSRQVMTFVRRNFLGGAGRAEDAADDDVYWQAQRRGAAGICLVLRDQPSGSWTHYGPYDGLMKPMPALWIGKREGKRLHRLARAGRRARLVLEGSALPGVTHNVWGTLPGASDEVVLVTSHHDAPFKGAVEDAAGVAQVLAQARAWARVPRERRPRTLVFVVDAGHFYGSAGAHAFARGHPEIMSRARVLFTLEHLGGVEVRERGDGYVSTGRPAVTVMFTTPRPELVAAVTRALAERPAPATAAVPADLIGPTPTSDAMGYVEEAGVPVVSWIGAPDYLLDDADRLDKIDRRALAPICATATEVVKNLMVL